MFRVQSQTYLLQALQRVHYPAPILLHSVQLKTMKPEEYRLIMRNLELHYQDYMRDSQDSQLFGPDDRMQIEEDYTKSTQHFESLLRSMEKGNFYFFLKSKVALNYSWLYKGNGNFTVYIYIYIFVIHLFRTND